MSYKKMDVFEYGNDMSWVEGEKLKPSESIFYNDFKDKIWVKEFYDYIKMILSKLIYHIDGYSSEEKKEILSRIVNKDTIKYFIFAVTTPTVEIEPTKNYETYETLGDKFMESSFLLYMKRRYPDVVTPSILTDIIHKILSTNLQGEACQKMGLANWVILFQPDKGKNNKIKLEPNQKIAEDVLESFFGALAYVFDYANCNRYAVDIFDSFNRLCFDSREFNFEEPKKNLPTKTAVEQFFQGTIGDLKRGGYFLNVEEDKIKNKITTTLHIPKDKMKILKDDYGIIFKNSVFGRGEARLKGSSEELAYEDAKKNMKNMKINGLDLFQYSEQMKLDRKTPENAKLLKKILTKQYGKNIEELKVENTYSNVKYTLLQLIVKFEDGKKTIVYTKLFKNDANTTMQEKIKETVDEYLNTLN
jgi:dsRNA-specific ribonuclease